MAVLTVAGSWLAGRTRLGFALRAIGEDETVARHTGVDTTLVQVLVFALTASVIALTGAILSLRYSYIDPNIAFNSAWSFQVLIMSLLGGRGTHLGPAAGSDSARPPPPSSWPARFPTTSASRSASASWTLLGKPSARPSSA